jgi:O-acetyl-ADP-ribose deacetylase (regulator of RNase III)
MAIKIQTKVGNLLHVKAGHIVHGCNAQGVMGSGVALGVKQDFPQAYEAYTQVYTKHGLKLGQAYPVLINPNLMIWNAVTQNLYGKGSRMVSYDAVEECFSVVNYFIHEHEADQKQAPTMEVHIPLIGSARGGGNWEIIREIIEQTMDYPVTLWLPDATVTTR